jgi:hypothetical protein
MFNAEEIIQTNNNWITYVFIMVLIILAVLNTFFGKRLSRTNQMLLNKSFLQIYYNKEKGKLLTKNSFLFFTIQVLSISLLLYLFFSTFSVKKFNFNTYLMLFAFVCSYFILRFLIGYFLAELFEIKNLFFKILFEKVNYLSNVILWILPLLLLSSYITFSKVMVIKLTFLFFITLLISRYFMILNNNKKLILNNLFYFILYICALEIAPLILIVKFAI